MSEIKNIIELKDICMEFDGEMVLDHLNLAIKDGEFVTLLGRSGCGKTTTLRIVSGLETPDTGEVILNGKDMTDLPPERWVTLRFSKPCRLTKRSISSTRSLISASGTLRRRRPKAMFSYTL